MTGVDDAEDDDDQLYEITFSVTSSGYYNAIAVPPLSITNRDDDDPGFVITSGQNLVTSEDGSRVVTFEMRLAIQPDAAVTVTLRSSDATEGTVSPDNLTFTRNNWNTPQSVTVTGVDDAEDDGDQSYEITFRVTSSGRYNAIAVPPLSITTCPSPTEMMMKRKRMTERRARIER